MRRTLTAKAGANLLTEKVTEGISVIVFFDEMESLIRTRGCGESSDVENTIAPQLLAETDDVEGLQNVT